MFHEKIKKVIDKQDLRVDEMTEAMKCLMNAETEEVLKSSFLTALKIKKPSVDEIYSAANFLRKKSSSIEIEGVTLDTCGTGGDMKHTFNISTVTGVICAAAGIPVVKHGNRSVSSNCGSADILEALGATINLSGEKVKKCIEATNFGFFYAPLFHQTMKEVSHTRKTLGFRTLFNILGPLANPTFAKTQILGVYDEQLVLPMAKVLKKLGVERALVVNGDGLDEISISAETTVAEVKDDKIRQYTINPVDFGLEKYPIEAIQSFTLENNKRMFMEVLENKPGAHRSICVLNAGAAIYINGKADSIQAGVDKAKEVLDSKEGLEQLEAYIEYSRRV